MDIPLSLPIDISAHVLESAATKGIYEMKKRFFTMLSLLIILSMFLVVPVSAQGRERKTIMSGAAASYNQGIKIPNNQANKFSRCIFNRRIIITSKGIYLNFGKYGKRHNLCLY